eukprot:COSAG01_NODE_7833_length_3035_cov_1.938351_4_plen_114_part_00
MGWCACAPAPVQHGYLLRRGGGETRWHSRVNCNHGDSSSSITSRRFGRLTSHIFMSSVASCSRSISGSYHQIFSAQARDVLDDIASNGLAADKSGWSTQQLKAFSELQVSRKD